VSRLDALLHRAAGDRAIVRCQQPVQVGDYSEPEPDLALVATRTSFYTDRHPTERDTLLIIEVSDSTLQDDLRQKMTLYARHGIREYWVVDLVNHRLHVFRNPIAGDYAQALTVDQPGTMDITALPGGSIDLSSLFA
jgi:Uma2 family endonuclease